MPQIIGTVPVYADDNGEVFVDPADVDSDSEEAGFLGLGKRARLSRIDRRLGRLERRRGRVLSKFDDYEEEVPMEAAPQADVYQAAAAAGMISENQFNGLGNVSLVASGTGSLSDTINRNLWGKSLVLTSDAPDQVIVTGVTVAGLPVNVGSQGAPLSMFAHDSTRFGISFGRRLALTGQTFQVNLQNVDAGNAHNVNGGIIADELNPYAMQRYMESMLLAAASQGFGGMGY